MASNSGSKTDRHAGGDQQEKDILLSAEEDEHYDLINEKGDYGASTKSIAHEITKELIARESEHNVVQSSEPATQSSYTLSTIMNTGDSYDNDGKIRSAESSDSEVFLIDEENSGSNVDSDIQNKKSSVGNVNELLKGQYDSTIDERLPETVTLLTTPDGGKLYLVGTAHFSVESQNDVSKIIQAVQPHMVVVELCRSRVGILQLDEETMFRYAKNIDFKTIMDTIKREGFYNGLLHILMLRMAAHVAKQLGMPPGGEFRRAFEEAKKVPNCIVHLADRPIKITMQRAIRLLSWWQTIKLGWHLATMKDPITQEDVELCKERSMLDQMIASMEEEFPVLEKVFVKERDIYLTNSLQLSCMPHHTANHTVEPARVVGIVGLGHTRGIIENWGKVKPADIPPIMRVPPPSLSSKIIKLTVKVSVLGAVIYIGYKIVAIPAASTFQTIKSSAEGLLKATASIDKYEHTASDVMYVVNNIPGPGVDVADFEAEYVVGCSCMVKCDNCSCTRGSANYFNARIVDEKLAGPVFECNSHCKCGPNCGNRLVQNGPLNCLIVKEVAGKGLGLFTTRLIKKGQFICEYAGEVIGSQEAQRRIEANKRHNMMNYVLVVREHIGDHVIVTCIDPKYFGNIGRYANHSCDPKSNLVPVRVEGIVPRLGLFASRDIKSGEEVTFDYADGAMANSVHYLSDTPCLCGSNNCFNYLPHNRI